MEQRADHDLAEMLRFENVAWYEGGQVRILDRRIYPIRKEYVICRTHQEVAQAIADMVTQSYGPFTAAGMGMALAAHEAAGKGESQLWEYMEQAAYTLSHARPTTSARMERVVKGALEAARQAVQADKDPEKALFEFAVQYIDTAYRSYGKIGAHLAELIPRKGTIMTQCFADAIIACAMRSCREMNNDVKVICPETRPYFQGARLTASVICDMGFDVTVITDNMPGYVLKQKHVDLFTSAADVITGDGHVVNKIGTFQIALAAKYHGIPYYVTGNPDPAHPDISTVRIEERDPELTLYAMDQKVTMDGVKGYYPAFDITPPELCSGVVTDQGVFFPSELGKYIRKEAAATD